MHQPPADHKLPPQRHSQAEVALLRKVCAKVLKIAPDVNQLLLSQVTLFDEPSSVQFSVDQVLTHLIEKVL
jgi:hypothetical protein